MFPLLYAPCQDPPEQIVGRPEFLQGGQLEDLTTVDGQLDPSLAPPEQIKDHPESLQGVLHYDPATTVYQTKKRQGPTNQISDHPEFLQDVHQNNLRLCRGLPNETKSPPEFSQGGQIDNSMTADGRKLPSQSPNSCTKSDTSQSKTKKTKKLEQGLCNKQINLENKQWKIKLKIFSFYLTILIL